MTNRVKQRNLSGDKKRDLRWGSHVPLNKAIMQTFPITGVLELGAGFNSTPVFFENAEHVVSIENDKGWIDKLIVEKAVVEDDSHKLVHHELPAEYYRGTRREQFDPKILKDSIKFFNSFVTDDFNLLFVDCYAGLRLEAINKLYKKFDVIVYHDAEPTEDHHYGYSTLKVNKDYCHYIDRTFLANTGFIFSKKLEPLFAQFVENYTKESEEWALKFGALCTVVLERQ